MSSDRETDTERTAVKTYVPAYQKSEWREHAEQLGMTQSEFVRTMVQAGRRGLEPEPEQPDSPDANPGGDGLEDRVLDMLVTGEHYSWDELVDGLAGDFEDRLEETLQQLQAENRVQYSGRHGGYTAIAGETDGSE